MRFALPSIWQLSDNSRMFEILVPLCRLLVIRRRLSVDFRKLQVAILARSPREMSQIDRILPSYIRSRVRVSFRPRICLYAKKPQTTVARPAAVDKQLNLNGHNPFSSAPRAQRQELSAKSSAPRAQRQELSAKTLLGSAAVRVQNPCKEQYLFSLLLFAINKAYF